VKVGLHAVGKRTISAHFGVLECAERPYCDGSDLKLWPIRYRCDVANSKIVQTPVWILQWHVSMSRASSDHN
jgi:hypothetical protein